MTANRWTAFTEGHTPCDGPLIEVDGNQLGIWRLCDGDRPQRACGNVSDPGAVVMVFNIDARIAPVVLADLIDVDVIGCLHLQQARFRIEGGASPIRATCVRGPHERAA